MVYLGTTRLRSTVHAYRRVLLKCRAPHGCRERLACRWPSRGTRLDWGSDKIVRAVSRVVYETGCVVGHGACTPYRADGPTDAEPDEP